MLIVTYIVCFYYYRTIPLHSPAVAVPGVNSTMANFYFRVLKVLGHSTWNTIIVFIIIIYTPPPLPLYRSLSSGFTSDFPPFSNGCCLCDAQLSQRLSFIVCGILAIVAHMAELQAA